MAVFARLSSPISAAWVLAAALFAAGPLAPIARAAETPDDDLVEVTPQHRPDTAAVSEDEAEDDWLTHAAKNAHGEVGAMIASDGSRAVYGTVTMPLGENGQITLSGSTGRMRYYPYDAYGRCDYRAPPMAAASYPVVPGAPLCALEGSPFIR
jgi:hypothetical protein